ncbi:methyltransferase domain-containing protein [Orrella sp. 11846]|uniref:methyltransferase domain-containing protein n=1 Tax=Orrella sp. 11846 TaxID=3409913 RepID=UPI003B5A5743
MKCRHCASSLEHIFLDLGFAPPSNAYLTQAGLSRPETYFPLRVRVCDNCWLVQTEDYARADELFNADYAYFSSASKGWLTHAANYAQQMIEQLSLDKNSLVVEIASNDGYLLRNFVEKGIPCLGIEPTDSTAQVAMSLGIEVLKEFFGQGLAEELRDTGRQADLIAGNNVYAHVPDINDFTRGLKTALKPSGTITLEFPHLLQLIEQVQFDTIYHEHFSYLSLYTVQRIFASAGLRVFDVQTLTTHGGSLRVFGCHVDDSRDTQKSVAMMLTKEKNAGLQDLDVYLGFQARANALKDELLKFLLEQKKAGHKVVAYGAAAKGNTLLNYAGIKPDLLEFVVDVAPAKQGKYMPGSHIPIQGPETLAKSQPDYVLILPWNIANEVIMQNENLYRSGVRFVTAVPTLKVL